MRPLTNESIRAGQKPQVFVNHLFLIQAEQDVPDEFYDSTTGARVLSVLDYPGLAYHLIRPRWLHSVFCSRQSFSFG